MMGQRWRAFAAERVVCGGDVGGCNDDLKVTTSSMVGREEIYLGFCLPPSAPGRSEWDCWQTRLDLERTCSQAEPIQNLSEPLAACDTISTAGSEASGFGLSSCSRSVGRSVVEPNERPEEEELCNGGNTYEVGPTT